MLLSAVVVLAVIMNNPTTYVQLEMVLLKLNLMEHVIVKMDTILKVRGKIAWSVLQNVRLALVAQLVSLVLRKETFLLTARA